MNPEKKKGIFHKVTHVFKNLSGSENAPVKTAASVPAKPVFAEHRQPEPVYTANFYGMGIAPGILETLSRLKFTVPTPIQYKAIPIAIEGKDVIGVAQTGTGKTLAFCVPMYQRLAQTTKNGLILVPTRELALQVDSVFQKIGVSFNNMKTAVLIGGAPMFPQISALRKNPRIIIATPGRLIDHLQQRNISLLNVGIVVLDEADRMLDMGFAPQIDRVLQCVSRERQTMLFSATIPPEIVRIASRYMKIPVSIEIAPSGTVADNIDQKLFVVNRDSKLRLLDKLLKQYHGPILMFIRTKHNASNITRKLREMGYRAAEIHSNRSLAQRREAMDGFKAGKYRILVATDIASRGIDVKGIELVINFDVPEDPENYVHRIGRTGRIGKQGHAITIATRDQKRDVQNIERFIKTVLPVASHPEVPSETFIQPSSSGFASRGRFGRSRPTFRHSAKRYGL